MASTSGAGQSPAIQQQQPLELTLLIDRYSVLRLNVDRTEYTPLWLMTEVISTNTSSDFSVAVSPISSLLNLSITPTEISVVLPSVAIPRDVAPQAMDSGWLAFRLEAPPGKQGPVVFGKDQWRTSWGSMGDLARISGVLAKAELSHFAVSTLDTDYILVKEETVPVAVKAVRKHACAVQLEDPENEFWTDLGWYLPDFAGPSQ